MAFRVVTITQGTAASGAVHFYAHHRNPVTLSDMDVKDRSSPVDSTWKKWHPEGPRSVYCS